MGCPKLGILQLRRRLYNNKGWAPSEEGAQPNR